MIGRRIIETLVVLALIWFCLSLKFILGFAAGAMLAGEIWTSMRGRDNG